MRWLVLLCLFYAGDNVSGGIWSAKDIAESKNGLTCDKADKLSMDESSLDISENTKVFGYEANFTAGKWFFEIEITPDLANRTGDEMSNFYCDFGYGGNEGDGVLAGDRVQWADNLQDGVKQTVKVEVNIPAYGSYKFGYWSTGQVPFKLHSFKVYELAEEPGETEEPQETEQPVTEPSTIPSTGDAAVHSLNLPPIAK